MYNKKDKSDKIELVVLKTINNKYEFDLVKSLLDQHEIPYLVQDEGSGGYMRIIGGNSLYTTKILVAEDVYEKAKDILEQITLQD